MSRSLRVVYSTLLLLLHASLCPVSSPAQTAASLNEGLMLAAAATTDGLTLSWWGRGGRTYFLQHTEDLLTWNYFPLVESGTDAVLRYGFTTTAPRFFVRLQATDQEVGDPSLADFDGDGISNAQELQQGTDPLPAADARLVVTWPAPGAAVSTRTLDVVGTWHAPSALRALSVNGVPAFLGAAGWAAQVIDLAPGVNTLTFVATDVSGRTDTTMRTATATYAPTQAVPLTVTADVASGPPPLAVVFTPNFTAAGTLHHVSYYFKGRAQADIVKTTLDPVAYTYTEPGLYYPTVTVLLKSGATYSSGGAGTATSLRLKIEVTGDLSPLAVWSVFKAALVDQDVERAVSMIGNAHREEYRSLLLEIGPQNAKRMAADLVDFVEVATLDEVAQYRANVADSSSVLTFPVCFVKEGSVWKIESF